jgi:hypothetical protein
MTRPAAKTLAALAACCSFAAGGAALAGAASNDSSSSSSTDRPAPPRETALTGDTAAKVKAAAEAKVPGGTVLRTEEDAQGGAAYEAHVRKSDGTEVVLLVDKAFKVVSVREHPRGVGGPGPRGGPGGHHGPGGRDCPPKDSGSGSSSGPSSGSSGTSDVPAGDAAAS